MSEYTFETAALKAVTIDAVKYNEEGLKNSLTAETVQAVVPIAWGDESYYFGTLTGTGGNSVGIGHNAQTQQYSVAVGSRATCRGRRSVAIGNTTFAQTYCVVVGDSTSAQKDLGVTIGAQFREQLGNEAVDHTCTSEGTGSITIGAGANTLNTTATDGTVTESSNSVTIGCKASNSGADSVVIGAQAKGTWASTVAIGAGAKTEHVGSVAIGKNAIANRESIAILGRTSNHFSIAIGCVSLCAGHYAVALGTAANGTAEKSVALGGRATTAGKKSIAIGYEAKVSTLGENAITLGAQFDELVDGETVTRTCTTEGTGSITIGAGANTLNTTKQVDGVDTVVESSNSVTIGCKAENKGADSVVIGASGSNGGAANVVLGVAAVAEYPWTSQGVALGDRAKVSGSGENVAVGADSYSVWKGVSVGRTAKAYASASLAVGAHAEVANNATHGIALGYASKANTANTIAIGANAKAADYGATVIRSNAQDGTYTQLYFSGTNTPLAKKYFPTAWEQKQDVDPETGDPLVDGDGNPVMVDDPEKPIAGEALMGYVSKDSAGNIIARGANMLSALFPYYTGEDDNPFQPTGMSLRGGEKPEPLAFHPSDLDVTTEEPVTEPEEYQPLPIYPVVEPEMKESEMSEYEPLPVYPIVEPETMQDEPDEYEPLPVYPIVEPEIPEIDE